MAASPGTRTLRSRLSTVGTSTAGTSTAGTSTAGTSTAGTSTAGTSTAGTSTAGTSTAGTSTAGTSTFWTDAIGTSAVAAILGGDPVALPGTPWSIRPAAGSAGRPAVEIYAAGSMVDVMVAPALAPRVLRGACSLAWAGQPCAVAWGFLPARPGFSVWFTCGPVRSRCCAAPVSVIGGSFWIAPAEGRFREVTVEHGGGRDRCRVRPARPGRPLFRRRPGGGRG